MRELAWVDYELSLDLSCDAEALKGAWSEALSRESWTVEKPSKKAKSGSVSIDIPTLVKEFNFTDNDAGEPALRIVLAAQNPGLNPSVLVNALTAEFPEFCPEHVHYRRLEVLDQDGKIFR